MILYLYAIVDGLDSVGDRRGVASEPLHLLTFESLSVVAGELPAMPLLDRAALVEQDRVVRELHALATALLPMRFGAGFASEADAARAIKTHAPALRDALTRVRGMEQMTLRITGATCATGATGATSGTNYLRSRAARGRTPEVNSLLEALATLQRATRLEAGNTAGVIATVYQLIDRGHDTEYLKVGNAAARDLEGVSVRITGPSPCYAFASM